MNFFGSVKAPFPSRALIFGDPNKLASVKSDAYGAAYSLVWERYVPSSFQGANGRTMRRNPTERGRMGDVVAAWSFDIPLGLTLRGLSINWVAAIPGYEGNRAGNFWEWGIGYQSFPVLLTGSSDYSAICYLQIATDTYATKWRNLPSVGAFGVKVSGANVWTELPFKKIDYDSLLDENGHKLLRGARRVHFRVVLGAEPSACTYNAVSYSVEASPKK
ncbi:MAG: hypothetical protein MZW92_31430 [Comamonadaceae bacterium]|nr:hypothetical protein [Comamonadaceae bacterium]